MALTASERDMKRKSKNIIYNARAIRKENKLSIPQFAEIVGVCPATLYRLEGALHTRYGNGGIGYFPQLKTVMKIANSINATAGQIMEERL